MIFAHGLGANVNHAEHGVILLVVMILLVAMILQVVMIQLVGVIQCYWLLQHDTNGFLIILAGEIPLAGKILLVIF